MVERQSLGRLDLRRGAGRPKHQIARILDAVVECDSAVGDARDAMAQSQPNAAPFELGSQAQADGTGTATWTLPVPVNAAGLQAWVQAAQTARVSHARSLTVQ